MFPFIPGFSNYDEIDESEIQNTGENAMTSRRQDAIQVPIVQAIQSEQTQSVHPGREMIGVYGLRSNSFPFDFIEVIDMNYH